MFWRTLIFAFLAVGVLAVKLEVSDRGRFNMKSTLTVLCKKAGGDVENKAEQLTNSVQPFFDCINPLVDTDTLKEEIKSAKSDEALNEVIKKYCDKTSAFKTCFHTLIDAASPCVEDSAKNQLPLAKNGTDQFFDYVCYNDGDRIAQFLTENGPECVMSKTTEINRCADTLQSQVSSLDKAMSLTVAEKCGRFDELTTCIFKSLETCNSHTPGNLLGSLIRYLRKGSVCNDALPLPQ